jgi:DNA repair protein RadC
VVHPIFAYRNFMLKMQRNEICSAAQAFEALQDLSTSSVEEFWAIALNPAKRIIACEMLFRGTVDHCLVHPRDVFRFACLSMNCFFWSETNSKNLVRR